jgi:hypothetical protein
MKRLTILFSITAATLLLAFTNSYGQEPPCEIDVQRETYPKSNWIPLQYLLRIEIGWDEITSFTPTEIWCDSDSQSLPAIQKTVKVVIPPLGISNSTEIWYGIIVWPAILTGNFNSEIETCTVSVEGCEGSDTFELNILSIAAIPLQD